MLSELSVENFAIIERLVASFDAGFTVVTGETGAGKSIIIDALQAALGSRTPSDIVRSGQRSAIVEAIFDWPGASPELLAILEEQGIDRDETLILRREIQASGRTTARVNGRALPVSILAAVGDLLVDIHGQSEHLSILRRQQQLDVLDRSAGLMGLRERVKAAVREYRRVAQAEQALRQGSSEVARRLDLLQFQVAEIGDAQLEVDEEDRLHEERQVLANAEKLAEYAASAVEGLTNESVVSELAQASSALQQLAAIDSRAEGLSERLAGAAVEIDDIAFEVRRYGDAIEFDPRRLEWVMERLETIRRLQRKYGATVPEILEFGRQATAELEDIETRDERLEELQREVQKAEAEALEVSHTLSRARAEAARALERAVHESLQGLGLKATEFQVEVSPRIAEQNGAGLEDASHLYLTETGIDSVGFNVSFNPGEPLRPLERVASGGETSRFFLALKAVLADADNTPTLVFDEVDAGVGGKAGAAVGEKLRVLALRHQVLAITHLPQVAALADQHLTVVKGVASERTDVDVVRLEGEKRVHELAHMMSGRDSAAALRSAEELLENASLERRPTH